jgi:hypothetical protein
MHTINQGTPWTFDYSPYRTNDGREIPCFEIVDCQGRRVAVTDEDTGEELQRADAALLAAAPELLEALELLLESSARTNEAFYVHGTRKALRAAFTGQKELLQKVRAAIAKAKGGAP